MRQGTYTATVNFTPNWHTTAWSAATSASNMGRWVYESSANTSTALTGSITLKTGNADNQIYSKFDCSSIPENATIDSVSCSVRAKISSTAGVSTRQLQMFYGSGTPMGSPVTISSTGTTGAVHVLDCGTWTREQLNDCYFRCYAKGTSARSITFFGATLSVTYTLSGNYYDVTVVNNSKDITLKPSASTEVFEGFDFEQRFFVTSGGGDDDIVVEDNGIVVSLENGPSGSTPANTVGPYYCYFIKNIDSDHTITISDNSASIFYTLSASSTFTGASVTTDCDFVRSGRRGVVSIDVADITSIIVKDNGEIVTPTPSHSETQYFIPAKFDSGWSVWQSIRTGSTGNGLTSSASTNYLQVDWKTGLKLSTRVPYFFNCSSIPRNATITDVDCTVKANVGNTTAGTVARRYVRLYSGAVAKSTAVTIGTGTGTTYTTSGGTWTREELDDIKILAYAQRNNSNTATTSSVYTTSFRGATLKVDYDLPAQYIIENTQGNHNITIEEAPHFTVTASSTYTGATVSISPTKVYQGQSALTEISVANLYEIRVKDNGVDVSSQVVEVGPGQYTYTTNNVQGDHTIVVEENPTFTLSAGSVATGITIEPTGGTVYGRDDFQFIVSGDITYAKVLDNGNDVTSSLVHVLTSGDTFTGNPSSLESSSDTVTDPNNACTGTDSTDCASIPLSGADVYMVYAFDVSSIPNDAVVNSVSCSVKANKDGSDSTAVVQLYCGATPMGQSTAVPTAVSVVDLTTGDWTREDLSNIKLKISGSYEGESVYGLYLYGADLIVDLTINKEHYTYTVSNILANHEIVVSAGRSLYIKRNGSWVQLNKIYKKVGGAWVEQANYVEAFGDDNIFFNG